MSFFDRLTHQFIEIIEWVDDTRDTMVYRFPVYDKEIKNGAKLTVREGQAAVFVREGKIADVMQPGMYTIDGHNTPILSSILGWKYGFESPFKAEVYFVATRQFTDMKWGTQNPIPMRDPELGVVRVRAFGTYAVQISDPGLFLKDIVGTDGLFQTEEINDYLRDMLLQSFTGAVSSTKVSVIDLAQNYRAIGQNLTKDISADLGGHGLTLTRFIISNISPPPEVEAMMDKRTEMNMMGNDMGKFAQFQAATAIPDAAKQPGGIAGLGMGLGAAAYMGGQMTSAFNASQPPPAQAAAPAAAAGDDIMGKLTQLKKLLDQGLIEKAEFDEKKKDLLAKL